MEKKNFLQRVRIAYKWNAQWKMIRSNWREHCVGTVVTLAETVMNVLALPVLLVFCVIYPVWFLLGQPIFIALRVSGKSPAWKDAERIVNSDK